MPVNSIDMEKKTTKEIKFVRPMPDSSIGEFSKSIDGINWPLMMAGSEPF